MAMSNRFGFYDVVIVIDASSSDAKSLIGTEGTVVAMAFCEDSESWTYGVACGPSDDVWAFEERCLEATGERRLKSDIYTGESVSIRVNPQSGRGEIKKVTEVRDR